MIRRISKFGWPAEFAETHGPVQEIQLFDGAVTLLVFGASRNWNYRGASHAEMESANLGITDALVWRMRIDRIKKVFAPHPALNAEVATESDLTVEVLPNFFRGTDADGVILTVPGHAGAFASADCLVGVAYDPENHQVAVLHLGRDALMDRDKIDGGEGREFGSVIGRACIMMRDQFGTDLTKLQVYLAAGIGPETFTHSFTDPKWGKSNKRMVEFLQKQDADFNFKDLPGIIGDPSEGRIHIPNIAKKQFILCGPVPDENITWDGVDTALDTDDEGNFIYHSNRRDKTCRNLVVVRLNANLPSWEEASEAAQALGCKSIAEYKRLYRQDPNLPAAPNMVYESIWEAKKGWAGFLGKLEKQ